MASPGMDRSEALALHRTMVMIRVFESRVEELFSAGKLPGFVHTYLGQEAIAAGVCSHLRPDDYITSTHRGHGHALAKGMAPAALMAELYGRVDGACRGRGGSMHVADFSLGMLGANGVVGGGFGIASGAALSARYRGTDKVAVCFFGDGGVNKGTFHEALNFASVHRLGVVFVCENNQYAQFTAWQRTTSVDDLAARAGAYAMAGETVDGNDVDAVSTAAAQAVDRPAPDPDRRCSTWRRTASAATTWVTPRCTATPPRWTSIATAIRYGAGRPRWPSEAGWTRVSAPRSGSTLPG